jgi:hypothetical protein
MGAYLTYLELSRSKDKQVIDVNETRQLVKIPSVFPAPDAAPPPDPAPPPDAAPPLDATPHTALPV